ncbi:polyadenylate-binding protein 1 [Octopus vulgaris]|uniref:Polyadenylate-binding protein n=1 Tax=Octopus vulgaris TaxID=6645 RepID=A0AA36B8R5_OCTVU|nr:polyadenylate-binding protein 1 [Octopus vulgaris]
MNEMNLLKVSLYVGDLHPEVTESQLYDKFVKIGPIESIRVCRNVLTKKSLGYAYVNFQNYLDAEKALDTLNFEAILGRPMRLMWSQRDPSLRRSGKGNVFIKNLDSSIDNKSLLDTFSAFGCILSCKIISDESGSKGYGFVHFEEEKAAEEAINKVNGMLLNGKTVYVAKFIPKKDRLKEKYKFSNVYIKNFGTDLDDDGLKNLFSKFGDIVSVKVMADEQGQPRGFGFVSFEKADDAERAVKELDGFELNGRKLFIGRAQKIEERKKMLKEKFDIPKTEEKFRYSGFNLYVKNLDEDFDDERLYQEFSKYGEISSARVMMQNGRSKGFGFVCFDQQEAADKAIKEMNGRIVLQKPLFVTFAQSKDERKKNINNLKDSVADTHSIIPPVTASYYLPTLPSRTSYPSQMHIGNVSRWQSPLIHQIPNQVSYNRLPTNHLKLRNSQNTRPFAGQPTGYRQNISPSFSGSGPSFMNTRPLYDNSTHSRNMEGLAMPHHLHNASLLHHTINPIPQHFKVPTQLTNLFQIPSVQQTKPEFTEKSLDSLSAVSPQEQKNFLGERLFPEVKKINDIMAQKITGMLLELDSSDIIHLIESPNVLREKVREAEMVLQQNPREKSFELDNNLFSATMGYA